MKLIRVKVYQSYCEVLNAIFLKSISMNLMFPQKELEKNHSTQIFHVYSILTLLSEELL